MYTTVLVHLKDISELTPQIPALARVFELFCKVTIGAFTKIYTK